MAQANASYHLRLLHGAGLLVIASEEVVRGGRAKRYRHPGDAPAASPTPHGETDRQAYVRVLADMIPRRFEERARGEGGLLTDSELWVEPETCDRVMALAIEASSLLHSSARPPRTEGTVRTAPSIAAFQLEGGDGA